MKKLADCERGNRLMIMLPLVRLQKKCIASLDYFFSIRYLNLEIVFKTQHRVTEINYDSMMYVIYIV